MDTQENVEQIILELKAELAEKYADFKGIYLYGSRVRGDHEIESDIDLMIVFDRLITWEFKWEVGAVVYSYMLRYNVVIDSHVYNYLDILMPHTPYREEVKKTGKYF